MQSSPTFCLFACSHLAEGGVQKKGFFSASFVGFLCSESLTFYKKLLQEDTCSHRDCTCRAPEASCIFGLETCWKSWRSWLDKVMSAGPEHYTTVRWCVRKPMIPPGGWLQQLRFKLCWLHNVIRSKLESPPGFLVQVFWPDRVSKKIGAGPKSDGIR